MTSLSFIRTASILVACFFISAGPLYAQTEDQKLTAFFKSYLDEMFRLRPLAATELGDHRFDARLEDLSPAARQKWRDQAQQALDALPREIDYAKLSRD